MTGIIRVHAAGGPQALSWLLLDRYLAGEANPSEAEAVRDWLAADPSRAEVLNDLRRLRDVLGQRPPARGVDAAWVSASRELGLGDSTHATHPERLGARRDSPRTWHVFSPSPLFSPGRIAAAATILIVAGATTFWRLEHRTPAPQTAPVPPPRVYATQRALRADVYLNDGTRVLLNVGSRLTVPASYGKQTRDVSLEGEAYFDVVHDSTRRFRVQTSVGIAEDIGTTFVVADYPETRGMKVSVTAGVVRVGRDSTAAAAAMLKRGDIARIDDSGRITARRGVNVGDEMAWTAGKLVFDRVPLRHVIPRLARWFDAEIRLGDSTLNDVRYTANIRDEPLEQVLQLLAASLDARVERVANTYVLHSRRHVP